MHSKVIAGDLAGKGKEYSNIPINSCYLILNTNA